jgi:hypothetical protein
MTAVLGTSDDGELLKKAAASFPAAFPELSHPGMSDTTTRIKP